MLVDKGVLRERLKKQDPLLYPLLQWIITSNRAHLRRLTATEEMKSLRTPWQYVLLSTPPEKEARFQRLKAAAEATHGVRLSVPLRLVSDSCLPPACVVVRCRFHSCADSWMARACVMVLLSRRARVLCTPSTAAQWATGTPFFARVSRWVGIKRTLHLGLCRLIVGLVAPAEHVEHDQPAARRCHGSWYLHGSAHGLLHAVLR